MKRRFYPNFASALEGSRFAGACACGGRLIERFTLTPASVLADPPYKRLPAHMRPKEEILSVECDSCSHYIGRIPFMQYIGGVATNLTEELRKQERP